MDALDDSAVFQRDHLDAECRVLAADTMLAFCLGSFQSDHGHRPQTGNVDQRTQRMRAVERRVHVVAPVILLAVSDARPDRLAVVDVFSLAVFKLADFSLSVQAAHLIRRGHVAVVLAVCVNHAGLFDRLDQLNRLFHGLHGQHFGKDVLARLHRPDRKRGVFVGVIGQHDGVHVVLDKVFKVCIVRDIRIVQGSLLAFEAFDPFVADCHHLRIIRLFTVIDHAGAAVCAHHADSDFLHILFLSCVISDSSLRC